MREEVELSCEGPARPDALHSNATTTLTLDRDEMEETVRWLHRVKRDKKGMKIPRRVTLALESFSHMLNAYPQAQSFSINANDVGQPVGIVGEANIPQIVHLGDPVPDGLH